MSKASSPVADQYGRPPPTGLQRYAGQPGYRSTGDGPQIGFGPAQPFNPGDFTAPFNGQQQDQEVNISDESVKQLSDGISNIFTRQIGNMVGFGGKSGVPTNAVITPQQQQSVNTMANQFIPPNAAGSVGQSAGNLF